MINTKQTEFKCSLILRRVDW